MMRFSQTNIEFEGCFVQLLRHLFNFVLLRLQLLILSVDSEKRFDPHVQLPPIPLAQSQMSSEVTLQDSNGFVCFHAFRKGSEKALKVS